MTPGERHATIAEIIEGLRQQQAEMFKTAGTTKTSRPFVLSFGPEASDSDLEAIMEAVRAEFPDWELHATRG